MADKAFRVTIGLVIGVWLARYLGPAQFGILSYGQAMVGLLVPIAGFGLKGVVVRELVRHPDQRDEILGTSFLLRIGAGILAWCLANGLVAWLRPEDTLLRLVVLILGATLLFRASEVVTDWFEAQVLSKWVVWMENLLVPITATVKAILILAGAPLLAFVWVSLASAILSAVGLLALYTWRVGSVRLWQARWSRCRLLSQACWPGIFAGIAVVVYMRIDQIMIGQMLDDDAVGIYAVAVKLSDIWNVLPLVITASVFPGLLRAHKVSMARFEQRCQTLLKMLVALALLAAVPMTWLATPLVGLLFGEPYAGAAPVLILHFWTSIFVFLGVAGSRWFLAQDLQHLALYRNGAGAVLNVGLNLYFIPAFGIIGAAWATLVSQALASVLFNGIRQVTRPLFYMQVRALTGFYRWSA